MSIIGFARLPKDSVTRTMLYLDQQVSLLEQELWHTAVFQRLYYLRQLGFSDKVFPDAVHNRFNHVLGACQRAEDILLAAVRNTQPSNVKMLAAKIGAIADKKKLSSHIEARVDVARLMALLHDLSHIPFGHTLEDELHLFGTKHDDMPRQLEMFNRVTAEFIAGLYDDIFGRWLEPSVSSISFEELLRLAKDLVDESRSKDCPSHLMHFVQFLVNLLGAQSALVLMHHPKEGEFLKELTVWRLLDGLAIEAERFDLVTDQFLIDAIGNTICADLLDYSRRDMRMANIVGDYDDRLFRWFTLSELEEEDRPRVRLAIKVFSNKLKPDVLREILKVLELRYDLAERILFHPAKCCAGAMLGRAVEALGLTDFLQEMLNMGDEAFLDWVAVQLLAAQDVIRALDDKRDVAIKMQRVHPKVLTSLGTKLKIASPDCAEAWMLGDRRERGLLGIEIDAGIALMERLRARHYYQLVFEVTTHSDQAVGKRISSKYVNGAARAKLMRDVERNCSLPPGTVLIHCPRSDTTLKEAEVLVLYSLTEPPVKLCKADEVSPQLERIAKRAQDMANDYKSIWRLRVYLHKAYRHQAASVADYLGGVLRTYNSDYLESSLHQLPYYQQGKAFLEKFGGGQGRHMIGRAVEEMRAPRMGTGGKRLSFEECLHRQEQSLDQMVPIEVRRHDAKGKPDPT